MSSCQFFACPPPDDRIGLEPCGEHLTDWCDSKIIDLFGEALARAAGQRAISIAGRRIRNRIIRGAV